MLCVVNALQKTNGMFTDGAKAKMSGYEGRRKHKVVKFMSVQVNWRQKYLYGCVALWSMEPGRVVERGTNPDHP
jgi:hypothetical protein